MAISAYKSALTESMTDLGRDPARRFIGYGLAGGKGALGTMSGVPLAQIVETPVAENLMVGLAVGMALRGLKPVVYFERADFMLCAADAIVNHLDKLAQISRGQFRPGVIIRVTVGNTANPPFTGPTHTQDLAHAFLHMVKMPVHRLFNASMIDECYNSADALADGGQSSILFDYKERY